MNKGPEGEDFVNQIAFSSFLQFWCYPGPFDITGDNKEICDLLIVFDKTCIIVSVKNYSFDDNYTRYFKKTTDKAIRQISGAERKLFGDRPILLKHPNRDAELFPKDEIKEVIRVVVNLNDQVKYYQTSHFSKDKHITIMDAHAWKHSIEELNTIPDFVKYIKTRCDLFSNHPAFILPREEYDFNEAAANSLRSELDGLAKNGLKFTMILGSEMDLIALYINNLFAFPSKLNLDSTNTLTLKLDGEWEKYCNSKVKSTLDEIQSEGYFIDQLGKEMLIDKENGHKVAKLFYSLDRIERSTFAKHFYEYHSNLLQNKEPIEYNRSHYVGLGLNLILLYFIEEVDMEELEGIIHLSMVHHAYLFDFKIKEIGLLGVSKNKEMYLFGYSNNLKVSEIELGEYIEMFKKLGWKLK